MCLRSSPPSLLVVSLPLAHFFVFSFWNVCVFVARVIFYVYRKIDYALQLPLLLIQIHTNTWNRFSSDVECMCAPLHLDFTISCKLIISKCSSSFFLLYSFSDATILMYILSFFVCLFVILSNQRPKFFSSTQNIHTQTHTKQHSTLEISWTIKLNWTY